MTYKSTTKVNNVVITFKLEELGSRVWYVCGLKTGFSPKTGQNRSPINFLATFSQNSLRWTYQTDNSTFIWSLKFVIKWQY